MLSVFFVGEVLLLIVCIFGSIWWIKNKATPDGEVYIGFNDYFIFGEDSDQTIEKMVNLAKEIFSKEELIKSEEGFYVQVTSKKNAITEVIVRTKKTKVTYTGNNDSISVINTVNTKTEVIIITAIIYWGLLSICWAVISILPVLFFLLKEIFQIFGAYFTA